MKARGWLYRAARGLGDAGAAAKGPTAYAKRRVRRKLYAAWNRPLRRFLR